MRYFKWKLHCKISTRSDNCTTLIDNCSPSRYNCKLAFKLLLCDILAINSSRAFMQVIYLCISNFNAHHGIQYKSCIYETMQVSLGATQPTSWCYACLCLKNKKKKMASSNKQKMLEVLKELSFSSDGVPNLQKVSINKIGTPISATKIYNTSITDTPYPLNRLKLYWNQSFWTK